MGRIVFYDVTTEEDRVQLEQAFAGSDREVITVPSHITAQNTFPDTEIISVFVTSTVTAEIIKKAPGLKCIACRSTGYNNIDLETAKDRGITVVNVPTYGSHTVAEYAFGLLLSLTRKIPEAMKAAAEGSSDRSTLKGFDLHGRTLGIIGAGRIGVCVASIAQGFGMRVLAYDAFPKAELAVEHHFTYVSLDELLAHSDVVSIHAPYTKENHHLLSGELIKKMRHGTILINTARGELVDNHMLIEALKSGHLGGAALDVLEGEQMLDRAEELLLLNSKNASEESLRHSLEISILQKLPNVIVTNHNAFNTSEAIGRINQTTIENIQAFLSSKPVNIVS